MASQGGASELPPNAFEDRTATVIGSVVFCLLWSTTLVGMRMWTRGVIIKQLGLDDYACVAGLLMLYGTGIAIAHMTTFGLGKHFYVMNPVNIPLYLRDFYVSIVMYCAALLFIKLSFLFQYYRVLAVGQRMRYVYIASIVVVGGWALSQVLVGIFACNPVSGFWDSTIKANCIPNIPQWYINAGGNIITDVLVFALPLPAIWGLQLPKASRLVLLGVFSLGFFTVIISIIRIRYLKLFEDFPWENVASSLWSVGELTSALTCACVPTLRPLVGRFLPSFATQAGRSSKGYAKSGTGGSSGVHRGTIEGSGLESGLGTVTGGGGIVSGHGHRKNRSVLDSPDGSEVELAQAKGGMRSNPFEVHVVREINMGVESPGASPGEMGVRGYVPPHAPKRTRSKGSLGGM